MPFPNIDPVLISIGPLDIRWYALAYIAGLLLGWVYALRLIQHNSLWGKAGAPFTRLHIDDFIVWATFGIMLGGRLGYVLFYNLEHFTQYPADIVKVWQGGMSFHGGAAGFVFATWLFCRKHSLPFVRLLDLSTACAPIGLFFGRLANFINAELVGRTTDVPWGVIFPGAGPLPRHPSQLYEAALEGLLLFFIIALAVWYKQAFQRPGLVLGLFCAGYGLARSFVELFRQPDQQLGFIFGGFTMGMLLSIPMAIIGLIIVFQSLKRPPLANAI